MTDKQKNQIFAMLAQLRPTSEWLTPERQMELLDLLKEKK